MTTIGEAWAIRNPSDEQSLITKRVVDIASAWQRGELPLEGVRDMCTGYERSIAVRCLGVRNVQHAVVDKMLEALIATEENYIMTEHGRFSRADLRGALARSLTDKYGRRVWQFPHAFDANGEPMYRDIPDHVAEERERDDNAKQR